MIGASIVDAFLWLAVLVIPGIALWQDRRYSRRPKDPMRWDDDE